MLNHMSCSVIRERQKTADWLQRQISDSSRLRLFAKLRSTLAHPVQPKLNRLLLLFTSTLRFFPQLVETARTMRRNQSVPKLCQLFSARQKLQVCQNTLHVLMRLRRISGNRHGIKRVLFLFAHEKTLLDMTMLLRILAQFLVGILERLIRGYQKLDRSRQLLFQHDLRF